MTEDADWSHLSVEQLRALQVRLSQSLQAKVRSERPATAVPEVLRTSANQYRAYVTDTLPSSAGERLAGLRRGMLAIELGSRGAEGGRLEGCVQWAASHLDTCLVVVADTAHRMTLRLNRGLQPGEARVAALEAGRQFMEQQGPLFERHAGACRFEFRLGSKVEKQPAFRTHLAALERLLLESESFRHAVRAYTQAHMGRSSRIVVDSHESESRSRLVTSRLVEELALFTCLAEEGWPVLVYPGLAEPLRGVLDVRPQGLPLALREVVWVGLELKKGGVQFMELAEPEPPGAGAPPPAAEPGAEPEEPRHAEAGSLLADLPEEGWSLLFAYTETLSYGPGEVVVRHGQPDRSLYIIAEGQLEIMLPGTERGAARRLALVAPGSVFGEQSFVDGEPRSASVIAATACKVHRLSRESFALLQRDEPELAARLLEDIARVLSLRLRQIRR